MSLKGPHVDSINNGGNVKRQYGIFKRWEILHARGAALRRKEGGFRRSPELSLESELLAE